jgi:hypothetical protein
LAPQGKQRAAFELQVQAAVIGQRSFQHHRPVARKVADQKMLVRHGAHQRAVIAIHAQNGAFQFVAGLAQQKLPGQRGPLLRMDLPLTGEIHSQLRPVQRRLVRLGLNREIVPGPQAAVNALEPAAGDLQAQLAVEIIPLRDQFARFDTGRRGTHRLHIFEEADARGRLGDFQPKGNQFPASQYGGVPGSVETGCQRRAGHGEKGEDASHSELKFINFTLCSRTSGLPPAYG